MNITREDHASNARGVCRHAESIRHHDGAGTLAFKGGASRGGRAIVDALVLILVGGSFLIIACVCAVALAVRAQQRHRLEAVGVWTTGRVETLDLDSDQGIIIVAFEDHTGRTRRAFASGTSSFQPRVGEPARVLYDPGDPSRAEIDVATATARLALVLMTCAFGLLGAGLVVSGLLRP